MTWATPFGSEVAQVRSPGSLHNRWFRGGPQQRCESELNSPRHNAQGPRPCRSGPCERQPAAPLP
ncbi:hypothetical protein BRN33_18660 [Xanthomonas oryzae pv. oryzae]|nr:hypothetical protein BRN91_21765 [Xanthomonas oryzae pv. oryzae]RBL08452.1 hypothetical protein BRN33_18660 [Xanthomonas oryzae pv. oryzae]UWU54633.1 hypothetical protein BRN95_21685 [Xanthomonas oryzae pv. oryzae]